MKRPASRALQALPLLSLLLACSPPRAGDETRGAGSGGAGGASSEGAAGSGGQAGASLGGAGQAGQAGAAGAGGKAGAGGSEEWAGWKQLPNTDEWPIYEPLDLASAVAPLAWSPCEDMPGCVKLDTPWGDGTRTPLLSGAFHKDGGKEWVTVYQQLAAGKLITALFSLTDGGKPVAAWGSSSAVVFVQPFWRSTVAVGMSRFFKTSPSELTCEIRVGPIEQAASLPVVTTLSTKQAAFAAAMEDPRLGDGIMAWKSGGIGLLDVASKQVSLIKVEGPQSLWYPRVAFNDVFFINQATSTYSLWVRRSDGSTEKLRQPPGVHVNWFDADGKDMAWVELSKPSSGSGPTFGAVELWTSPYGNTGSQLEPRKLGSVPFLVGLPMTPPTMRVNDGVALADWDAPRIYRLTDGSYYLPPSKFAGLEHWQAIYVDSTEYVAHMKGAFYDTLVRVKLEGLPLKSPDP